MVSGSCIFGVYSRVGCTGCLGEFCTTYRVHAPHLPTAHRNCAVLVVSLFLALSPPQLASAMITTSVQDCMVGERITHRAGRRCPGCVIYKMDALTRPNWYQPVPRMPFLWQVLKNNCSTKGTRFMLRSSVLQSPVLATPIQMLHFKIGKDLLVSCYIG